MVCAVFAGWIALTLAAGAATDPHTEFNTSFNAYRDAFAASAYEQAATHAAEARRLGEEIFGDDAEVTATLALNHGYALAMARRKNDAYRVLIEARKRMRQAFDKDSERLVGLETSLLNTAPDDAAPGHLREALKLARRHYPEDGELIAELKLNGGSTVPWSRQALRLLQEAAETFDRLGKTERQARAQFWIGKIRLGRDNYRKVVEPMSKVVDLLPADDRMALMARANLVEAFEKLGERDLATKHCLAIGRTTPWTGTADYQPLFKRPPAYPRNALSKRKEGHVLVQFTVDEMGFVRNPAVVASFLGASARDPVKNELTDAFEAAALEAVTGFRYAPRFVDGKAVAVDNVHNMFVFVMRK